MSAVVKATKHKNKEPYINSHKDTKLHFTKAQNAKSLFAVALYLLPASKRGAVHLTARKATHTLANRIFVKVPIL